jgi:hypothetical protein
MVMSIDALLASACAELFQAVEPMAAVLWRVLRQPTLCR